MTSGRKPTILIEGKSFREISAEYGIHPMTLRARWYPGITIKELVKAPRHGFRTLRVDGITLKELSRRHGISYMTLYWRLMHGMVTVESITRARYEPRARKKK